jgi:hypothetical protein
VPTRFLTPWFIEAIDGLPDSARDKKLRVLANRHFGEPDKGPPYRFCGQAIELHSSWVEYLFGNRFYVRIFALHTLLQRLERLNPSGIKSSMLEPPLTRSLKPARRLWRALAASQTFGDLRCFYSGAPLRRTSFSLDHFMPWDLVATDRIWNLVPAQKSVNSKKGNRLPKLDVYLAEFVSIQWKVFQFCAAHPATIGADDQVVFKGAYENLLGIDLENASAMNHHRFHQALTMRIDREWALGARCGSPTNWVL